MNRSAGQEQLLKDVLASFRHCEDPRLRQLMEAVVRHLHQLVSEVGLTRDEWAAAIRFLTDVGQKCDDVRQEFILLSDTLGVSSLVEMINAPGVPGTTENTVLGPFYVSGSPERAFGESIVVDDGSGDPVTVSGVVRGTDGDAIVGARVDVWEAAAHGLYAVQDAGRQHPDNLRGVFRTDSDGRFEFRAVRPVVYPVPDDGPVGQLLGRAGRHAMRAAHVHLMVSAPGYEPVITHLFDAESRYLDSDAVFGVRPSLIVPFSKTESGELSARFDVTLSRKT
jgi:protocatechuate 3,4-dioxygenase beta subunit